jgi:hypothetical protein
MTAAIDTTDAERAVEGLREQAREVGEQYKNERDVAEKTRVEKVAPTIIALTRISLSQKEIARLMQLSRAAVMAVQRDAGLVKPRKKRAGEST